VSDDRDTYDDLSPAVTTAAAEPPRDGPVTRAEFDELAGHVGRWVGVQRFVMKWVLPPLGTVALAAAGAWLAADRAAHREDGAASVRRETAAADHALLHQLAVDHARLQGQVAALGAQLAALFGPRWVVPAPAPPITQEPITP
jgi:hypothetical protein